jgi:hypothetical protein
MSHLESQVSHLANRKSVFRKVKKGPFARLPGVTPEAPDVTSVRPDVTSGALLFRCDICLQNPWTDVTSRTRCHI